MNKIKRGTGKIEFFTNLDYLEKKYYAGYVIAKELFDLTKKEKNITMSYKQFTIYFKKYIFSQDKRFTNLELGENESELTNKLEEQKVINKAPKIKKIIVGDKKRKPYNPHTRKIDPKDIL